MTICIGMKITGGRVLIAADRRTTTGGTILCSPATKITKFRDWLLATSGSTADVHLFLHGLPPDTDFADPFWYSARIKTVTEHDNGLTEVSGEPNGISFAMIAAKGPDLYAYNAHGAMWPAGDWDVCGASATTALAWLTNHAPTGMDEAEARARARQLYEFMSAAELSIGDGLDIEVT